MPQKKQKRAAGRGRSKQPLSDIPPPPPASPERSPSRHSDDDHLSDKESNVSPEVSVIETADPGAQDSSSSLATDEKLKRARKTACCLTDEEENSMLEFLEEHPLLWDIKLTDYRRTDKKNKLWDEQAAKLGKTADYLKGWFKSLRDNYTRLDKKKSGDGAPELTEREQWVKSSFGFMKPATRHCPEPVNSVSTCIRIVFSQSNN